jgi:(2Fe-2S) ferredoxin
LIAKSAFAASPHLEMRRLADLVAALQPDAALRFAFTEQGTPSLREALSALLDEDVDNVVIVPLVLPMEPSFHIWLTKSLKRWKASDERPWPALSIASDFASSALMAPLIGNLLETSEELNVPSGKTPTMEGSLVPPQKRRVLVCTGGACNSAGADVIWNHLRNQQERRKLRVTGDGTMTAKSTCLGPCNLAPVLQVFPEGTYYGGVTEEAVDRIITEHLLGGHAVEDFAYRPTGRKQRLRTRSDQN